MTKHILIVGYGSAALAVLKALQDLPEEFRRGWRISVFERRHGIGGQWCVLPSGIMSVLSMSPRLPDDGLGEVALTGLYDRLRTNTPVHMSKSGCRPPGSSTLKLFLSSDIPS